MFDFKYETPVTSNLTKWSNTQMFLKDGIFLDYEMYSAHAFTWIVTVSHD